MSCFFQTDMLFATKLLNDHKTVVRRSTCIALDTSVALMDHSLVALEAKILEAIGSSNWTVACPVKRNDA